MNKVLPGLIFLFSLLLPPGCGEDAEEPVCEVDCRTCAQGVCPRTHCGLQIVISPGCTDLVGPAEVAVDQCVQDEILEPGTSTLLCQALPIHSQAGIIIRTDERLWEETVECTEIKGGGIIVVTATCDEK